MSELDYSHSGNKLQISRNSLNRDLLESCRKIIENVTRAIKVPVVMRLGDEILMPFDEDLKTMGLQATETMLSGFWTQYNQEAIVKLFHTSSCDSPQFLVAEDKAVIDFYMLDTSQSEIDSNYELEEFVLIGIGPWGEDRKGKAWHTYDDQSLYTYFAEILKNIGENCKERLLWQVQHQKTLNLLKKLRRGDDILIHLLQLAKMGVWSADLRTNIMKPGENWLEMLKLEFLKDESPEVITAYFNNHIHPEDREVVAKAIQDFQTSQESNYSMQFRFAMPDGEYIWLDSIGGILDIDDPDEKYQFVGINREITHEQQFKQELRQKNILLENILNALPSGVFWKDVNSVYRLANPVFARDTGAETVENVIGKTDKELQLVSADYEYYRQKDLEVIRTGVPELHIKETLPIGGEYGCSYSSRIPLYDEDGSIMGILGVYTDITELEKSTKELQERETKLQAILDNTGDIIWTLSADGLVEFVNPAVEGILGYTQNEAKLLTFGDVLDTAGLRQLQEITLKFPKKQNDFNKKSITERVVVDMRAKSGQFITTEVIITAIYNMHGDLMQFLLVQRDMSERKILEDRIRQAQKLDAVGRLAGGLAHDFNNMLQVILGYSELLLDKSESDPDMTGMLNSMVEAASHSKDLVMQLLKYSRQDAIRLEKVDFGQYVADSVNIIKRILDPGIQLEVQIEPELPSIKIDKQQIEQLIINLCLNAQEAITENYPKEIELTIKTESTLRDIPLYSDTLIAGDYVKLTISDRGRGMSTEQLEHVFEPFYTTKVIGDGVGLGLATVYGIVRHHGAFVGVTSEVGKGTSFSIYFPTMLN